MILKGLVSKPENNGKRANIVRHGLSIIVGQGPSQTPLKFVVLRATVRRLK